jgi:hypothetical protein
MEEDTVTVADVVGNTCMVIRLDVAGFPVAQLALEVSRQVTASPLTGLYV